MAAELANGDREPVLSGQGKAEAPMLLLRKLAKDELDAVIWLQMPSFCRLSRLTTDYWTRISR